MRVRLNRALQAPSLSICEELERDLGPKPGIENPHREALAKVFAEREAIGMARYGKPLDPFELERRWVPETIEELADGCVYMTAELRLLAPEKRADFDAKWRHTRVKEARRHIEKAMLILLELEK